MEEQLGEPNKAKDMYEDGRKKFTSFAPVFEAALDELESAPTKKKPAGGAMLPRMGEAEALAVLMVAFQAGKEPADAGKAGDEAGFEFWRSLKSASKHDYPTALKTLDAAIKAHDKNRFQRLRNLTIEMLACPVSNTT
jgi:hypothetical protein